MTLITLIFVVVVGFLAWAINDRIPYEPKWIGQVIILALGLLWFANAAGLSLGIK